MKTKLIIAVFILLTGSAYAHPGHEMVKVDGIVRSVNTIRGTITFEHEEVEHLKWKAATETLETISPTVIKGVTKNDKVHLTLKNFGQQYVVTEIERK